MITTYHRPETLDEALKLLAVPQARPLGGGTTLARGSAEPVEVVDLQALGLNSILRKGSELELGATVTLQALLEAVECPAPLKPAIRLEAPLNIRNSATLAGTLVSCDGRSTLAACLLALDAKLEILNPQPETMGLGSFLPLRPRGLITLITINLNARFAFESVGRTPADKPIICAALAQWPSGRARLVIGGFGTAPSLAMDGTEAEGLEAAARNACHEAADAFGSAEYRMEVGATLAQRCLRSLS
ncbi:MAG: FAD binding domain-containing protein [Bacteroidota bacterium]